MSSPAKSIVLRAILPNDPSVKIALAREGTAPIESDLLTLSSEKMTTEAIVSRIKELSKLRDEIVLAMRQLSILRDPGTKPTDAITYSDDLESIRQDLNETRSRYQDIQGKIEGIQRQIDDSKKLISGLTELSKTGFTSEQLESKVGEFRRILGRVPVKKLETVQKVVHAQLKDQAILAIGNKGKETAYILVATPKDKSSQALQTLLLFDFSQVDIPEYSSVDLDAGFPAEKEKVGALTKEQEELKRQQDDMRNAAALVLNRKLDAIVDSLILLRGTLKLGEGTQASRVYSRLEKALPAATMKELTKKGIIEVETLS